ncbi:DUF2480 family protein [Cyclobacterium jeungdonense]|uniref:DUF2480 family protein n=1 Tax=Cyclobacterium jeungdonense TaxID=708087 RepID=A0ABT8CAN9_9BACT|nr:DUF2480 family protein [Cyclobacterium jeungdonense]MDN3689039.1 DUF2480 family protein [Cyclobacterium jeungdonense]
MSEITNRVANSPIVTIDLESFYEKGDRILFDLEPLLFQGMVVREKEFRQQVKELEASVYQDKLVGVYCSVDAIIPTWAYMLVVVRLQEVAREVVIGDLKELEIHLMAKALQKLDIEALRDKPVVVKGCSKLPVPNYAYGELVRLVLPVVKSLMFGEPCSTVPVYKRPKAIRD